MKKDLSCYRKYSREEVERAIDQYIIFRRNAERDRAILKRILFDGVTYECAAEEFGLTPRRVSDIVYETEEILFKHL